MKFYLLLSAVLLVVFADEGINPEGPCADDQKCTPNCYLAKFKCMALENLICGPDEKPADRDYSICKCCPYCKKVEIKRPTCTPNCSLVRMACTPKDKLKCRYAEIPTDADPSICKCCPYCAKCSPDCRLVDVKCTPINELKCKPGEIRSEANASICKCCPYCRRR